MLFRSKIPPGTDLPGLGQQIEKLFGAEVVAKLPLNSEIAKLASAGLFCLQSPEHPFSQELARVADRLLSEPSTLAETVC